MVGPAAAGAGAGSGSRDPSGRAQRNTHRTFRHQDPGHRFGPTATLGANRVGCGFTLGCGGDRVGAAGPDDGIAESDRLYTAGRQLWNKRTPLAFREALVVFQRSARGDRRRLRESRGVVAPGLCPGRRLHRCDCRCRHVGVRDLVFAITSAGIRRSPLIAFTRRLRRMPRRSNCASGPRPVVSRAGRDEAVAVARVRALAPRARAERSDHREAPRVLTVSFQAA